MLLRSVKQYNQGRKMSEVQDVRDVKKTFVAPTIKSFEHYDFSRAKICCSLTWLVAKAYGTGRCWTSRATTCTLHDVACPFTPGLTHVHQHV